MKKTRIASFVFYILVLVILLTAVTALFGRSKADYLSYSEAVTLFAEEKVHDFTIKDGVLTMTARCTPAELGTADLAEWFLLAQVPRDALDSVPENFQLVLE